MNNPTIADLRRNGHKVRVYHRPVMEEDKRESVVQKGLVDFVTEITVTMSDGRTATGCAYKNKRDGYNRKLGNKIALGRALKQLNASLHSPEWSAA